MPSLEEVEATAPPHPPSWGPFLLGGGLATAKPTLSVVVKQEGRRRYFTLSVSANVGTNRTCYDDLEGRNFCQIQAFIAEV